MPELTVRESIWHSARIRLPSSWTDKECQVHVDKLIACLGLDKVQHTVVGDAVSSSISGGQRKRVCIGIELVAAPVALFLDEPTSGLDATNALMILRTLKTLSQLGITVVCVIHQPRAEILDLLDGIHLLSGGSQVYHGKASKIAEYFAGLGFDIPGRGNITDAVLDIVSGHSAAYGKDRGSDEMAVAKSITTKELAEHWSNSVEASTVQNPPSPPDGTTPPSGLPDKPHRRGASWPMQVRLCFVRSAKQQWRSKTSFLLEICVGAVCGMLIGLSVYELKGRHFQGIYLPPFELLSSAVNYHLVPEIGLLCCLAIGMLARHCVLSQQ